MGKTFRGSFTQAQLVKSATVTANAGEITRLGEYKVEAGENITLGYGEQSGQDNAVGRFFVDLKDNATTPANVEGLIRIQAYTAQNRPMFIYAEYRSEVLRHGANDRSLQVPMPESIDWLGEDKRFVLEFIADTTATISKTNSKILLDTTVEELA